MLYYYTGKGTPEDLLFATLLNLKVNETCFVEQQINISSVIIYFNIRPIAKNIPYEKLKQYWFTPMAFKPCSL